MRRHPSASIARRHIAQCAYLQSTSHFFSNHPSLVGSLNARVASSDKVFLSDRDQTDSRAFPRAIFTIEKRSGWIFHTTDALAYILILGAILVLGAVFVLYAISME